MTYEHKKEPLYRKVNTLTRYNHHNSGGDYRHDRNTKAQKENDEFGILHQNRQGMGKSVKRGLDYTPLFKFLLSKVGKEWTAIHSEAVSRLDKEEPIFWLVARTKNDRREVVNISENSYYSGLYIDENGILQKVNTHFSNTPSLVCCTCCTHSFNGVPIKIDLSKNTSPV